MGRRILSRRMEGCVRGKWSDIYPGRRKTSKTAVQVIGPSSVKRTTPIRERGGCQECRDWGDGEKKQGCDPWSEKK